MGLSIADFIAVGALLVVLLLLERNNSPGLGFSIYHLAAIMVCLAWLAVMVVRADSAFSAGFILSALARVTTHPFRAKRDAPGPSWIGRLTPRDQEAIVWFIAALMLIVAALLFLNPFGLQERYAMGMNWILGRPKAVLGAGLWSQVLILLWLVGLPVAIAGQRLDARPWRPYLLGAVAMCIAWLLAVAEHVRVGTI